ncbi:T9SS type A sorting domain-containing protein [candidate division WOR-3 bacterium]|nr:T9SS type A sorting domain-containing protein [candidate division WOR-3 bacterium]
MKYKVLLFVLVLFLVPAFADSLNVRLIGNWPFGPSQAATCDSARNLVFCGSGGGVYVLDVSNPSQPVKVSEAIHTGGFVEGFFYRSNLLYIADGQAGLEIWDVTNPNSPSKLGSYDTPYSAYGVYVSGSYAYVADYSGLRVIDVSDPRNPQEIGNYDTPRYTYGVYVSGSYVYVADWDAGLQIYQFVPPGEEKGIASPSARNGLVVYPNPARSSFTIRLSEGVDRIKIYDCDGRLVKEIASGSRPRNDREGEDCKENIVTIQLDNIKSGVYFVQAGKRTEKLIVKGR